MSYAPLDAPSLNRASNSRDSSLLSSHSSFQTTGKRINSHRRPRRSGDDHPIIVHSHLGWDWVWQRPQQFLSRLSKRHRVLYVEGPLLVEENITPWSVLRDDPTYPNVTIMQMKFPASRFSEGAWVDRERFRLLREALNGPL